MDLMISMDEIKELMAHLSNCNLESISIKEGDFELNIKAPNPVNYTAVVPQPVMQTAPILETAQTVSANEEKQEKAADGNIVKSPIVGTFYSSPAPDKDPFVKVGSRVKKGDTLFIIESMKLMNEVQSDFDGEVTEIMLTDGTGVEYNQPIMVIK